MINKRTQTASQAFSIHACRGQRSEAGDDSVRDCKSLSLCVKALISKGLQKKFAGLLANVANHEVQAHKVKYLLKKIDREKHFFFPRGLVFDTK